MKAVSDHDKLDHMGNPIFSGNDNSEGRPACAAAQHGRQASVSAGADDGRHGGRPSE